MPFVNDLDASASNTLPRSSATSTLLLSLSVTLLAACADPNATSDTPPELSDKLDRALAEPDVPRGRQLALGRAHACSLDPDISGVLCWGDNRRGQTNVPTLLAPRFIATGGDVSCAISAGGVSCWGDNTHRQRSVPAGLRDSRQLAVGEAHACALSGAGTVRCWGENTSGQLDVPDLRGVRAIAAGARHTCALGAFGVRCWGDDAQAQLAVPPLTSPRQLAAGGAHTCAIDGERVVCWGGDNPALLDDIPEVSGPIELAAGGSHSCVLDAGGVQCWGSSEAAGLSPRELTQPTQVVVGGSGDQAFACARHLQGIACWGDDSRGQATYIGDPLHVLYRAQADIEAPPELVWDVLMDLDNYGLWNPYTTAMVSTLQVGDPMVMTVRMSALLTLTQTEYIRVLDDGRYKACWGIDSTTPTLNSGERCQWLEPLPDGGTRYITEDLIEGSLNPLVQGLFDADLQRGFEGVATGLKARAEWLARRP
jgi:alpha-tubulin suppressor-like RCC1 family protein